MATCIKNFNIYWFGATLLLFWFFFIHAPPVLIQDHAKDRPLLCLHLCCAFSISVACIHNSLLTPSLFDGQAQPFHVWVGRVGLIAGIVSFCAGGYIAWFQQDDLGFATGITIGGLLQLNAARLGYGSIQRYLKVKKQLEGDKENGELKQQKDAALQEHIVQMLVVFVMGCLIPAAIRIIQKFDHQVVAAVLIIAGLRLVLGRYAAFMTRNLKPGVPLLGSSS